MHRSLRLFFCTLGLVPCFAGTISAADWPMYGRDMRHSFHNPDSAITPLNVALLEEAWTFVPQHTAPTVRDAFTASPSVVDGVVYVGSWDGFFYAINLQTGAETWRFQVDCQNSKGLLPVPPHCPQPAVPGDRMGTDGGIITSSAAVVDGPFSCPAQGVGATTARAVFFGGGKTLYSLDAATGELCWKHVLCGNPEVTSCEQDADDPTRIFSSPVVYGGKVFVGLSADGIEVPGKRYRGGFEAHDVNTGDLKWRFEVDVAPEEHKSCGNVWSSAAIAEDMTGDPLVFFNTADCDFFAPAPYHEAVIALHANSGALAWVFRPREEDFGCDFDFGASPNVIDLVGGGRYLGNGGKDGTYYLLDRASGTVAWSKRVVFGGLSGGFIGSTAFDGKRIYGGTGFGELGRGDLACEPTNPTDTALQEPSMHAFDAATGVVVPPSGWQQVLNYTFAASTVANGVVFVGSTLPPALRAYHSTTGALLRIWPMEGAVSSGATLVGDMVIFGSGNSHDGAGSALHALRLSEAVGQ